jgi:hypothetical protein
MFRKTVSIAILLSLAAAFGTPSPVPSPSGPAGGAEPPGCDVFTTPREALLREKPSASARVLSRLPQGTRLTLSEVSELGVQFLRVEAAGLPPGWVSRGVVIVFRPDLASTKDLAAVGRTFAGNEGNRKLAAALLERAAARLREAKTPDPETEILAGETAEAAAASGGPFPGGLAILEKTDSSGTRAAYSGAAFERALALIGNDTSRESLSLRERALAGRLRSRFPAVSTSLPALAEETQAWLALADTAENTDVLRLAAERAGAASLALGRFLLALGKVQDLAELSRRLSSAGARAQVLMPGSRDGRRLTARGRLLAAMRGTGALSFPQEVRVTIGPKERIVRIAGKLGALQLSIETTVGGTRGIQTMRAATPLLPVPGSLRVSPDGKSAAWIEVIGPAALVPVMTPLEKDEPAREIAFVSGGRPLRDQALAHVVSTLSGFSKDGQRLGLSIDAWNDAPGPAPRYSVVSVATGQLLFETSRDLKSFERLLQ